LSVRINQEALLVGVQGDTYPGHVRINQLAVLVLAPTNLNAAQVQIIGGPFQDNLGNALSNGYLLFQLQHDAVAFGTGQIMGNVSTQVPLDINGYIQGTHTGAPVFIWPNASLLPAGGNYIIWAYTSTNGLAWDNPQIQSIPAISPFNVNDWIPGP
jgi:hypothetical protein